MLVFTVRCSPLDGSVTVSVRVLAPQKKMESTADVDCPLSLSGAHFSLIHCVFLSSSSLSVVAHVPAEDLLAVGLSSGLRTLQPPEL